VSPATAVDETSFTIATPGNWFSIRLPRGEAGADELADQLSGAWPGGQAPSEEELRGLVRSLVSAATALDVLCAYATVFNSGERWLPASLVVNAFAQRGQTLSQIAEQLSGAEAPGRPGASLVDLPAGPAVRIEQLRESDGSPDGRQPVSLLVQYVIEAPGSEQALVLTFSTPALGMAEQLRPLFQAMARTVRFEGQEPGR
jgi:hypothetical protein